ncbi:MAG: hypothetical protein MUC55_04940 [Burkholderiales bacterium]|jgi:hypothetical protein|nr:hypothetical protein [Burkholderiales bacterium]
MKAAPNKTVVTGKLRKFEPAADGYGGDVEIEVARNESPDPAADFIKPQPGKTLRAFYAQPEPSASALPIGKRVRVELTFLGGPGGGRAVVQSLKAE